MQLLFTSLNIVKHSITSRCMLIISVKEVM